MPSTQAIPADLRFWHLPVTARATATRSTPTSCSISGSRSALFTLANVLLLPAFSESVRPARCTSSRSSTFRSSASLSSFSSSGSGPTPLGQAALHRRRAPFRSKSRHAIRLVLPLSRRTTPPSARPATRSSPPPKQPVGIDPADPHGADDIVRRQLVLPAGREVDLTSAPSRRDPRLRRSRDAPEQNAVPGQTQHIHFTPSPRRPTPSSARRSAASATYRMQAMLRVLPAPQFNRWLAQQEDENKSRRSDETSRRCSCLCFS